MTIDVRNSINSAIVSGTLGFQRASDGITQAASNIARQTVQNQNRDPAELLVDSAQQQIANTRNLLPDVNDDLVSQIVALEVNLTNAGASARVVETANDTVGRLIDILA